MPVRLSKIYLAAEAEFDEILHGTAEAVPFQKQKSPFKTNARLSNKKSFLAG